MICQIILYVISVCDIIFFSITLRTEVTDTNEDDAECNINTNIVIRLDFHTTHASADWTVLGPTTYWWTQIILAISDLDKGLDSKQTYINFSDYILHDVQLKIQDLIVTAIMISF